MAWRSDEEVRAWLANSPRADDEVYCARLPRLLESIRTTGFCVWQPGSTSALLVPQFQDLLDSAGEVPDAELLRQLVQRLTFSGTEAYLPEEIADVRRVAVGLVTAPVWGLGADPSIEISVHVYREAMPVEEVLALGRRLDGIRLLVAAVAAAVPVDTGTGLS